MSSSSLLGKSHIALAPMNGVGYCFVWLYATDVNPISNGANTKTYSSICIALQFIPHRPDTCPSTQIECGGFRRPGIQLNRLGQFQIFADCLQRFLVDCTRSTY
jgi:hypothetical protein